MKNKLKILFFCHNGKPYGANKSLFTLIKYLNTNYDVLLMVPFANSLNEDYKANEISQISLPFFPIIFFFRKKIRYLLFPLLQILNFFMFPVLLYRVWKFKPDIIYSNSSIENMGWIVSKFLKVKHITHVREFGDLDYSFIPLYGKRFKIWSLNESAGLIFNSNVVQEHVLPIHLQKTICRTIYNGIESIDSNNKDRDNNSINIGIVGYIHKEKCQLEAVHFMKDLLMKYNSVFLSIYGDGEKKYIESIKKYALENNIEKKIFFMGYISDTNNIYKSIDILLNFSKNEAFGRVTIEAMRDGIPVLGYNNAGTAELIVDNVDGFLFDDKNDFTSKFEKLISDKKTYDLISNNSRNKVKELFSDEKYTKDIEKFIIEIQNN
ncbi:glycosyltransferase family 4 protein [Flavobacterium maritimum]|uniref:glycosyltransferase family 4 protein n=1 Tax=Flavobacterium maritimum TaxID=3149042 RepID=UPI0032B6197A